MARPRKDFPDPVKHFKSGQERIRIRLSDGKYKDIYLGPIGSKEAKIRYAEEYQKFKMESYATPAEGGTVADIVTYQLMMSKRQVQEGLLSPGTYDLIKRSFIYLLELYRDLPANDFEPRHLVAVRNRMIESCGHQKKNPETGVFEWIPVARKTINARITTIKQLFRNAAGAVLIKPSVYGALTVVSNLKPFETKARETKTVHSAEESDIQKTLAVLDRDNPVVGDMLRIHRLTGMRSTELCLMRPCDFRRDFEDGIWEYEPSEHKTEHFGKARVIPIGPKAQKILIHYLNESEPTDYLFSPRKAVAIQKQIQMERNPNPVRGSQKGRKEVPERTPGDVYNKDSYRTAVKRAAQRGGVTVNIFPHQMRHSAATEIDQKIGKEAARTTLGHSSAKTTDRYTDYNRPLAHKTALELG